jgi:hypothetical protein
LICDLEDLNEQKSFLENKKAFIKYNLLSGCFNTLQKMDIMLTNALHKLAVTVCDSRENAIPGVQRAARKITSSLKLEQ